MADLRAILRRFRPLVVPPGLAAPATIPADPAAELRAELARIVGLIDEIEDAAEALEQDARLDADRLRAAGDATARSVVADATRAAAAARADAYLARRRSRDDEIQVEDADARREIARIRRSATARMPGLVEKVVDCVAAGAVPAGLER